MRMILLIIQKRQLDIALCPGCIGTPDHRSDALLAEIRISHPIAGRDLSRDIVILRVNFMCHEVLGRIFHILLIDVFCHLCVRPAHPRRVVHVLRRQAVDLWVHIYKCKHSKRRGSDPNSGGRNSDIVLCGKVLQINECKAQNKWGENLRDRKVSVQELHVGEHCRMAAEQVRDIVPGEVLCGHEERKNRKRPAIHGRRRDALFSLCPVLHKQNEKQQQNQSRNDTGSILNVEEADFRAPRRIRSEIPREQFIPCKSGVLDADVLLIWLRQCKVMLGKKQRDEKPRVKKQRKDRRLHKHEKALLPEYIPDIEKEQKDHELRADHAGQHVAFDDAGETDHGRNPASSIRGVFRIFRKKAEKSIDDQRQEDHGLRLTERIAVINAGKAVWIEEVNHGAGITDESVPGNFPRAVIG